MTSLKLIAIFITVLLFDGLVLPAFFGFRGSFLFVLVLIMPVLYLGLTKNLVFFGLFFSLILELFRGLNFGVLAMPFLFTVAVIYLTQRFLDIQYTYDTRFNLSRSGLIVLMSVAFIYVFSFFYRYFDISTRLPDGQAFRHFDILSVLTMVLEALALVFVFNSVFNKKSDYL
ncbi:MAG: hypothetical protein HYX22_00925 [Candidatus Yanofskybacteria bacterium]|nr:hypothetical protein [Candidatus Yanofskybacteria bacterium]